MALGPQLHGMEAAFDQIPPMYPITAKGGNCAPYTVTHSYTLPDGQTIQTHTSLFPEGFENRTDFVWQRFDLTPLPTLYAAKNSTDVFLEGHYSGGFQSISFSKLMDTFAGYPRAYAVRHTGDDNHTGHFYGWQICQFLRTYGDRDTYYVAHKSGVEPWVVGLDRYYLDEYLRKFTFKQLIGQDPDPRGTMGGTP